MRDTLIIFVSLIAAIVIGGSLYLYGGPMFHVTTSTKSASGTKLITLAEGQNALNFDTQVNYRITNQADLETLWGMVYGGNGPLVPTIDFTQNEVLAVFDGTHSTGGFNVHIRDVVDAGGKRTIDIVRTAPAEGCVTANAITSPFEIISIAKSPLPLTHVDEMATASCSQ